MKNIEVFISSTQIELECEREIAKDVIDSLSLKGFLFELSPALSSSPKKAFLEAVDNCEIYVLILWKKFSEAVFDEYKRAVMKNKPILVFVKSIEYEYDEKRDNKLQDFIKSYYGGGSINNLRITKLISFRSLKDLREALTQSIKHQIEKLFEEPFTTQSREEMYDLGSEIINHSQKRLYIYQRTPTLFFGLKDRQMAERYLGDFERYEERFLESLEVWIERHRLINDVKFCYLFDLEKSREELAMMPTPEEKDKLSEYIRERLLFYKKVEKETKYNFKFSVTTKPISGPLIIGDNTFGIWITGKMANDSIAFSHENIKISNILCKIVDHHIEKSKSVEEIMTLLN